MITNDDRIRWLRERISYVEHKSADGTSCVKTPIGGYWPQGECGGENDDPDAIGLSFVEYIDYIIGSGK